MSTAERATDRCRRGHPFDATNTLLVERHDRTERVCRACHRMRQRERGRRVREQAIEAGQARRRGRLDAATWFWSRVEKTPTCWLWRGYVGPDGYGHAVDEHGRTVKAHQFAVKLAGVSTPPGHEPDHVCRVRHCVRYDPKHIQVVTKRVNILRSYSPAGLNHRKTHCPKGHEYAGHNLIVRRYASGRSGRKCRTCIREQARAKRRALPDALHVSHRDRVSKGDPMFHAYDGWFFDREPDGSVTIYQRAEAKPEAALITAKTFPPDTWASIVAAVCRDGERSETFQRARELHVGERHPVVPGWRPPHKES